MRNALTQTLRTLALPLALGVCGAVGLPAATVSTVHAGHPFADRSETGTFDRLGRILGIGWGDGYHACHPRSEGWKADLPPANQSAPPYMHSHDPAAGAFDHAQQNRLPWLSHTSR